MKRLMTIGVFVSVIYGNVGSVEATVSQADGNQYVSLNSTTHYYEALNQNGLLVDQSLEINGGPQTYLKIKGQNVGTNVAAFSHDSSALQLFNNNLTNGNFSSIQFFNGNQLMDAAIHGVHEDHVQRRGAIAFSTHNGQGNMAERVRINPSGFVGIGTSHPVEKLQLAGGDILLDSGRGVRGPGGQEQIRFQRTDGVKLNAGGQEWMRITPQGNVGIGTTTPQHRLDVRGEAVVYGRSSSSSPDHGVKLSYSDSNQSGIIDSLSSGTHLELRTNNQTRLFIKDGTGNIGIGTLDPQAKLAVNGDGQFNGTLYAQAIRVNTSFWPDYVFAANYNLMPLSQVEKHIKLEQHLPGLPSAKEVEANGVDMGEMQKKLLEKIEELTLHVIELNKRVSQQEKEISHWKNVNKAAI